MEKFSFKRQVMHKSQKRMRRSRVIQNRVPLCHPAIDRILREHIDMRLADGKSPHRAQIIHTLSLSESFSSAKAS